MSKKLFCPDCETEIEEGKLFCPKCMCPGQTKEELEAYKKKVAEGSENPISEAEVLETVATEGDVLILSFDQETADENKEEKSCSHMGPGNPCKCNADVNEEFEDDVFYDEDEEFDEASVNDVKQAIKNVALVTGVIALGLVAFKFFRKK